MSKFEPNVGKVLVEVNADTGRSSGGIYIPASAVSDGVKTGKVVAVGPTRTVDGVPTALVFQVGDQVLIDPLGGMKLKVNGVEQILLRAEDVVGKLV